MVRAGVMFIDAGVTIHEEWAREQSLGSFQGAFARLLYGASGQEIACFDLLVTGAKQAAITVAKLHRYGEQWRFRIIGQGWCFRGHRDMNPGHEPGT